MGTKTLTEINTMWKAAWRGCRAAALLGIVLAFTSSAAHAQATRITSASGLAAGDTTLPYTITDSTFVPSYSGSAGGDPLTFTDAGQSLYEVRQGASFDGAFADGTNLLATINGSGGPAGPLTITFASGVTEFGLDAQNAWFGFEVFTFVPYSGTTPLGTYTVLAHDTGPAGLAFLGARAASGSITSVQISSTSSVSGKGNIFVVGPITYAPPAPSTTLTSSLNPSYAGQSVTFTATVTGSPTPTGAVQFAIDGGNVGSPVTLDGSGRATDTEAALALGTHAVTVTYAPTGTFSGNTVATLTQSVIPHVSPQYVSPTGSDGSDGSQGSPKLTIQAAINATESGDTIIAEDGTYTGAGDVDLDFGGRNLTVTSQNGPATTIIDCGGSSRAIHRGFFFHSGETNAVVSGLTIQNGNEGSGNGADLDIATGSTVTITDCIFSKSQANQGGGIFNGGTLTLTGCTLTSDGASDAGGGLYNGNFATLTGCTFTASTATNGGGIYNLVNSTAALTNCVLTANSAGGDGGGMDNGGTATLTNCTFTGNHAGSLGGGLNAGRPATLVNCLFWGDTGSSQPEINGGVTATNCDIQGGDSQAGFAGTGTLDADPLFVNGNAPYDLHLRPGSPCLGAGTSAGAPTTDKDGSRRPAPPSIGAYELAGGYTHLLWNAADGQVQVWAVAADGTHTLTGTYGPYTDDGAGLWHATALATAPDGTIRLLWDNTDGRVALWNVDAQGGFTIAGYGPYGEPGSSDNWTATDLSVGPDGVTHILWNHSDGRVALWYVNADGTYGLTGVFGPYGEPNSSDVWHATGIATGPNGVTRILWGHSDGRVTLWYVNADGSYGLSGVYGPYSEPNSAANWAATSVSVGPDGVTHILWNHSDGRVILWYVNTDGSYGLDGVYGPYGEPNSNDVWHTASLATGSDGVSRLLWKHSDGRATLWYVNPDNSYGLTDVFAADADSAGQPWEATSLSGD